MVLVHNGDDLFVMQVGANSGDTTLEFGTYFYYWSSLE